MIEKHSTTYKDFILFTEIELEACLQFITSFRLSWRDNEHQIQKLHEVKVNPQKNNKKDNPPPKQEKEVISKMKQEELKKF